MSSVSMKGAKVARCGGSKGEEKKKYKKVSRGGKT